MPDPQCTATTQNGPRPVAGWAATNELTGVRTASTRGNYRSEPVVICPRELWDFMVFHLSDEGFTQQHLGGNTCRGCGHRERDGHHPDCAFGIMGKRMQLEQPQEASDAQSM